MADEPDLSAIGVDAPPALVPSDLARREEQQFGLDHLKEHHEHEIKKRDRELGKIGTFFGSRENAITYIVAAFALISLILIAVFTYGDDEGSKIAVEFFKAVGFACIGFITGKSFEKKE